MSSQLLELLLHPQSGQLIIPGAGSVLDGGVRPRGATENKQVRRTMSSIQGAMSARSACSPDRPRLTPCSSSPLVRRERFPLRPLGRWADEGEGACRGRGDGVHGGPSCAGHRRAQARPLPTRTQWLGEDGPSEGRARTPARERIRRRRTLHGQRGTVGDERDVGKREENAVRWRRRKELTVEVSVAGLLLMRMRDVHLVGEDVDCSVDSGSKEQVRPACERERSDNLPSGRRRSGGFRLVLLLRVDLELDFLRERGGVVLREGRVVGGHLGKKRDRRGSWLGRSPRGRAMSDLPSFSENAVSPTDCTRVRCDTAGEEVVRHDIDGTRWMLIETKMR